MSAQQVVILEGEHAGEVAFVTWDGGAFLRVTPVLGDPLVSIELRAWQVRAYTEEENTDV